ncbi:hypothetical protein QE410_003236 [Microbacterium sp. SORGH_AS 1204]|uniref:PGN_0703 family putative restriction endonuclease n=1 Tax=Microbacterium sp. SORGH_AS_1204 TaxID=3041785 RepID=UPI00278E40DD|nr:hypothetical protein [Microbacterium sp. SORGH_AS_1204]MDQ1138437.1 hypothetical protein [Microbacterium sp. SORGH_AS_1204]
MRETTPRAPVSLSALGDQPRLSEPKHARRARFHQSWYRVVQLGVRGWGTTPKGRPLGSILPPAAAAAGRNFTSPEAEAMFVKRRNLGWGVDPVRMTSHMTSSQTLLMNLLGPLADDPDWLLEVLRVVLARPNLTEVLDVAVEFAPPKRSHYLGDMTRVDAFVKLAVEGGIEGLVLELKYADRFSSRRLPVSESPRYRDLAESTSLWRSPGHTFSDGSANQLVRCHALGARTLQVDLGATVPVTLMLVHHPLDLSAGPVFDAYRRQLADPKLATRIDLELFLQTALVSAPSIGQARGIQTLQLRYVRHEESEPLWHELLAATQPARRR